MIGNFSYDMLSNPKVFSVGTLAPHSSHIHYRNRQELEQKESSFYLSLNGSWKFHYSDNPMQMPVDFEKLDYDCSNWDEITVPSHIQLSGYGQAQYVNSVYPWDGHEYVKPGQTTSQQNSIGSYIKTFVLPIKMLKEKIRISFQGAETAIAVWINGKFVGYAEDSFTPSEFDITNYLIEGKNKLAVQCFQRSSGSWLEDQNFWRFSGIFRDVNIYSVPKTHIEDIGVKTQLDLNNTSAYIKVDLTLIGDDSVEITAILYGPNRTMIAQKTILGDIGTINFSINNPMLWSAESPNLYTLHFIVFKDGEILEEIAQKVGVRKFEIRNGIMELNGRRIVFKGVNRHEFNCMTGRAITKYDMEIDIQTMKKNNINALRTSHYPNQNYLYELCDEYGIYVIDEANIEAHGTCQMLGKVVLNQNTLPGNKPEWLDNVLYRAKSMFERDKNHPSILIWSCGSESGGGKNLYKVSQYFKQQDSSRLVHYEGIFHDRRFNQTSDIESQMYTPTERIKEFLKNNKEKPFICCEYAQTLGNSTGGLSYYTKLTKSEKQFQGGFIQGFIDQTLLKKDCHGTYFMAIGGDFDDRPTDYSCCANGLLFADRILTPKMAEVKYCYQPFDINCTWEKITIQNNEVFCDTSKYVLVFSLQREDESIQEIIKDDYEPILPGEKVEFNNPFSIEQICDVCILTVSLRLKNDELWAEKGYEVSFGQCVYHGTGQKNKINYESPQIVDSETNFAVKGEYYHIIFSKQYCGIISYIKDGEELISSLAGIPRPNFWRAPTDVDIGWQMPFKCSKWKTASLYSNVKMISCENLEESVIINTQHHFPSSETASCKISYKFCGNGEILITMKLIDAENFGYMPDFGMVFKMPLKYKNIKWHGRGISDSYCDRKQGCKIGVYKSTVSEQFIPYARVQDCGNHTDSTKLEITDDDGTGILIQSENMDFSVLPYTPHQLESACHPNELPVPQYAVVRVSAGAMGIGADDSWGATPHRQYIKTASQQKTFSFTICGV